MSLRAWGLNSVCFVYSFVEQTWKDKEDKIHYGTQLPTPSTNTLYANLALSALFLSTDAHFWIGESSSQDE